jgi:hypothetical protein
MAENEGTDYVVLRETDDYAWSVQGTVRARSAQEAIRRVAEADDRAEGVFRAVPERSWRTQIKVRTEQVVQRKFDAVDDAPATKPPTPKQPPSA